MKNLIKCHYNYLFTKTTILIFLMVLIISILGNIVSLTSIDRSYSYIVNNTIYQQNVCFIINLLANFLSIFIFSYSFLSKSDQYVHLILVRNVSRFKYFTSKFLSISIILFFFIYFELFIYLVVAFLGYTKYSFNTSIIEYFINLFFQIIFNGLISLVLVQILDNIYIVIIPFSSLIIGSIINEESNFASRIFSLIIPSFSYGETRLVHGIIHVVFLITLLSIINITIYSRRDL